MTCCGLNDKEEKKLLLLLEGDCSDFDDIDENSSDELDEVQHIATDLHGDEEAVFEEYCHV